MPAIFSDCAGGGSRIYRFRLFVVALGSMAIFDYFRFKLAIGAELAVTSLIYPTIDPGSALFPHFSLRNIAEPSQELLLALLAFATHTHTHTQNIWKSIFWD